MDKFTVKECGRYDNRNFIERIIYTEIFICEYQSPECTTFWRNCNEYQIPVHMYMDDQVTKQMQAVFTVPVWWFDRARVVSDYSQLEMNFIELKKMAIEKGIKW